MLRDRGLQPMVKEDISVTGTVLIGRETENLGEFLDVHCNTVVTVQ